MTICSATALQRPGAVPRYIPTFCLWALCVVTVACAPPQVLGQNGELPVMEVEPAGVPIDGPADDHVWNREHLIFVWSIVLGSIAGGLSIVGLVIWLVLRHEKKRTENLASIALELGMTFSPTEDEELLSKLPGIPLFQQGRSRRMKNVMSAATDANQLTMFDYSYTTGGGKTVRTHHYTLFVMESSVIHLPTFSLRPEGMLDRFGAKIGFQDIGFDQNLTFSEMFVLQSDNEATVRAFFDEELLAHFAVREGIAIDCIPDLFMYQKGGRKKPEEFRSFMADGFDLFKLLSARAASSL